jgi:hypothetical protein
LFDVTVLIRKSLVDQFSPAIKTGVSELDPTLALGEPRIVEDENGAKWFAFRDGRWRQIQIAMLASTAQNAARLSTYDSQYVTDEGEVLDRDALHEESKAVLQDPNEVDTPMTLPEDVTPSDPDADRPSMEDIRAAQEAQAGDLDPKFRLERSLDNYTRVNVNETP